MTSDNWLRHRATQLLLVVLLLSVGENALLLYRNHSLTKKMKPPSRPPSLLVGEDIGNIRVKELSGRDTTLALKEDSLVLIYSAKCPYSRKNFANWRVLESRAQKQHIVYISIDLNQPAHERLEFAKHEQIDARVFVFADENEIARLKVFSVPQTLRVVGGKVKTIDLGLLSADRTAAIGQQCDTAI